MRRLEFNQITRRAPGELPARPQVLASGSLSFRADEAKQVAAVSDRPGEEPVPAPVARESTAPQSGGQG